MLCQPVIITSPASFTMHSKDQAGMRPVEVWETLCITLQRGETGVKPKEGLMTPTPDPGNILQYLKKQHLFEPILICKKNLISFKKVAGARGKRGLSQAAEDKLVPQFLGGIAEADWDCTLRGTALRCQTLAPGQS